MLKNGKKVVFVSVPMAGKDDAVIERAIQAAKKHYLREKKLSIKDVAFINNFDKRDKEQTFAGNEPLWYLGRALKRLAVVDEAVFGEGWHKARGCICEFQACGFYGVPITVIFNCKKEDELKMYDEGGSVLDDYCEKMSMTEIFLG